MVIRFGRDWDPDCMRQDEVLYRIADKVKNFAVIYLCDIDQVPDFNQMYELYDPWYANNLFYAFFTLACFFNATVCADFDYLARSCFSSETST